MAIQLPDPGQGDGKTGDNEYVMWTKVKDNFSNTTHAASRLVGESSGNLMQVGAFGLGTPISLPAETDIKEYDWRTGFYLISNPTAIPDSISNGYSGWYYITAIKYNYLNIVLYITKFGASETYVFRRFANNWQTPEKLYTTSNTTKDTATGFLKASSPVLHVYNDSITKIHEAEQLDITVDKKGVGHYEIHGTTGLRKNDGWFMSPPRDVHGNVLCMVDLEEKDGVVILKTYKKLFDFETVSIVHDYDNPMDIPEGVCVEFRFNDLPQEQLDEPIE